MSRPTLGDSYIGRMRADQYSLRALLLTVSGWVNRHQQQVIEYLIKEIGCTCLLLS